MTRPPVDDRIRQPPCLIVNVDDTFAHDLTVGESDEPRIPVELRIHDELARKSRVDGADVTDCSPNMLGRGVDLYLLTNGSHRSSFRFFS